MTFGQLMASSPGRRSGVAVWRQIADTLTTEIRNRAYVATGRLREVKDDSTASRIPAAE